MVFKIKFIIKTKHLRTKEIFIHLSIKIKIQKELFYITYFYIIIYNISSINY